MFSFEALQSGRSIVSRRIEAEERVASAVSSKLTLQPTTIFCTTLNPLVVVPGKSGQVRLGQAGVRGKSQAGIDGYAKLERECRIQS